MAEQKKKAEPKARGPVRYIAFAEITPGFWALVAAGREASSVYTLRKELRAELQDAQADAGKDITSHRLVIIPADQAHVVEAEQTITVTERFTKTTLKDAPPLSSVVGGPPTLSPEAAVAARMGADALPTPGVVGPGEAAAMAARAAAVAALPPDPDDEDRRNPDLDPVTGLSVRTAAAARPEDEGRTVFPIDGDE